MKKDAKRMWASVIALIMIMSIMPINAFAIEGEDTPESPALACVCEVKCTDEQVDESCPVCGAEGADLKTCKGVEPAQSEPVTCTCETKCVDGAMNDDCPVCGVENADLSACKGKETIPELECTCETKCTEDAIDTMCVVCGAENADLTQCKGKEVVPELTCTCETQCTEDTQNDGCEKCAADWTQCQGIALTAPNPLSGDGLPTENATCSYVSNENGKTRAGVTLAEAIDVLNKNGGGTITVTSSGCAGATNIKILSPITILPDPGKKITVTAPQEMKEYDGIFVIDKYDYSNPNQENRVLTLGQDGLEDGALTFDGARVDNSCIVTGKGNGEEESNTGVVLRDGVVLTGCTASAIGAENQNYPKVTMYGGQIKENYGDYAVVGAPFMMMGGEICNNVSETATIFAPYVSNRTTIGGDAYIHDNQAEGIGGISAYGYLTIQDNALIEKCKSTGDSTGGAAAAFGDLIMKNHAKIAQCEGAVGGAAASLTTLIMQDYSSIENCRSTSTAIEVYAFPGGAQAQSAQIGPNAKITGCTGMTGGLAIANTLGDAEDIAQSRIEGEISGNTGILGGGISAMTYVDVTIADGAKIVNNIATEAGGGIAVWSSISLDQNNYPKTILTVEGGTISGNTAPRGGGVFVAGRNESLDYEEQAEYGYYVGYCYLKMSGGTITGNIADNPESGTATEFHGGGVFLGWDVETNVSGTVNISGNIDENGNPSNMYLRKDPNYTVIDPGEDTGEADPDKELNILKQFVADAAKAQFDADFDGVENQIMNELSDDDIKGGLPYLVEQGAINESWLDFEGPFTQEKRTELWNEYSAYLDLIAPQQIAEYQAQHLDDYIAAYRQQYSFVPTYEQFKLWYIDIVLEAQKYEIQAKVAEMTQEELTEAAINLGFIEPGQSYTGTKEDFLNAVMEFYKKYYETDPDMDEGLTDTYNKLWDIEIASTSKNQDARLYVTGALTGSQIGVTAEGAQNGRIIAVGTDAYKVTDADLAVFTSNDQGFSVVWHPDNPTQMMLKAKGYTITAYAGNNGSISESGSIWVAEGSNKTFTITPDEGYYISDVKIDGISQGAINSYTFEDVRADHTIEAIFAKNDVGGGGGGASHPEYTPDDDDENTDRDDEDDTEEFTDEEVPLAETPWLNTEDHYAYIVGYSEDGTVRPNANITRAEVATIFFRLLTDDARDQFWSTSNNFSDVAPDAWYNNAVSTMVNAGIIQGYEDGTFRPNASITRAEFAAIASRFMSAGYDVEEDLFTDIAAHWARESINDAAMAKWISGYPDGTFLPDKAITRAEAVTLVNNVLQRKPDADRMLDSMVKWPDNMDTSAWYYEAIQEATNSHDYDLFEGAEYETWTSLLENRDWAALEKDWVNAHRTGGEVM